MTDQSAPGFAPTPPGARILLAGASGYIGKFVARELVAQGFRVICLMRDAALPAQERRQFMAIVTPNHLHYTVAAATLEAGFHVMSDKPAF